MAYRRVHCYAASFGNDLAKDLLNRFGTPGGNVLDPFVGSGTTLIEALFAGYSAVGIDIDPIACLITRTQVRKYTTDWLIEFENKVLMDLDRIEIELVNGLIDQADLCPGKSFPIMGLDAKIPERPEIDFWFTPTQRLVLASLVAYMQALVDSREVDIFSVSVSSSIVRKWPNTISRAMDIDHSRPHRATPEYSSISQYLRLFRKVFHITIKALTNIAETSEKWLHEGRVIEGNCTEEMMSFVSESVDLILTSPPYVNAIDYPRSHKFSEWWISPETGSCTSSRYIGLRGIDQDINAINYAMKLAPNCMKEMVWLNGKNISQKSGKVFRYINDMGKVIEGCKRVLKTDGRLIFVLANNHINGNVVPVVDIVMEMLKTQDFKDVASEYRTIQRSRRRYPFNFKGVMDTEAVITALR